MVPMLVLLVLGRMGLPGRFSLDNVFFFFDLLASLVARAIERSSPLFLALACQSRRGRGPRVGLACVQSCEVFTYLGLFVKGE